MDAPPPIEFASMDRIQQLYADLPTVFAKEIARRQLAFGPQYSPTPPSALVNGTLKRSRPDDVTDPMNKRRDVGETKSHSMQPPAIPSISISGSGQRISPTSSFTAPVHPTLSVNSAPAMPQSPRVSSPSISMPPPMSTPSLPFGASEASIAATSRARAREAQIHQAREQQLRAAQMQQQQMQGTRQISPPTTSPQIQQSSGSATPQHPHASFAPNAMQILQNPSHPLMAYLTSQIPNFTSLPVPQQLQKLTSFQHILAQKQQQSPSNQQRPLMPSQMPGLGQNPSMSPMPNAPMSSAGPSPVSPLGQQSPVVSQSQQMSAQSPQSGMYPFSNQVHGAPGIDPRMASSNFTPQMSGNMNAMNMNQQQQQQQQRQMMMMQQQMRNTGNMNAPNIMNQQQAYAMQQRMPQGGPSQVGGSPMSAPANDTFPALRSNSTIPGIARSGRSPSESVHSPMTPRAPSRLSSQPPMQPEDYQRAMSQQAQQGMMGTPQNSGSFHPQMQYHQWQNGQQQQQQQQQQLSLGGQMNGYGMSPQGISPSGPNWQQQQGMNGYYPQGNQRPQNMSGASMQQNISPVGDTTGVGEYDIFNWNGQ
ncbi:hypothetical protein M405DRAFT_812395 [Rhizopogon salebrosus TDB-379]|nr:hypothetical protein M405DRAFT_812395 [Rhizopogon salebrosus TDB-379]